MDTKKGPHVFTFGPRFDVMPSLTAINAPFFRMNGDAVVKLDRFRLVGC
jgi:hypothetical protein